jgi:FtsP/CotA-like multicopper oxidase with cupredoxin domain
MPRITGVPIRPLSVLLALLGVVFASACAVSSTASGSGGRARTYYVAADEVDWNYAPSGRDQSMDMAFTGMARDFMEHGPHRIGSTYRKAIFREYADGTFTTLRPRQAEWEHAGILGPILRAEVGDTITVVFKNNGTHPYSMHPHGMFYQKHSEGSSYDDGSSAADKVGGGVPPGQVHTYTWEVPERAGPGPNDLSSVVWLYHSHANELQDVNAGLIGAMIVTRRGMARPDGSPKDVDREFAALFMVFDENQSWFLDYNVQHHTDDPKGTKKDDLIPVDSQGRFNFVGPLGFAGVNVRSTINGLQYGNMPMMTMKQGERVRWYLVTIGFGFNFHTPHWHGNVVMQDGKRTDVLALSPAQMLTVDMIPDDPGIWLFHCHVSDHMEAGMMARYEVLPKN